MSSPAQIAANRQNALSSTGPKTPEGKRIASQNAAVHGLTGKKLVLDTEDQAAYDAERERLYRLHNMKTDEERLLVDRFVEAQWRLNRCRRVETALFDRTIAEVQSEDGALDADEAMASLFTDEKHAGKMRLFLRYQAAIERAYNDADRELKSYVNDRDRLRPAFMMPDRTGFVSQRAAVAGQRPAAPAPEPQLRTVNAGASPRTSAAQVRPVDTL